MMTSVGVPAPVPNDGTPTPLASLGWRRPALVLVLLGLGTWLLLPRLLHANPLSSLRALRWPLVAAAFAAQAASQWGRALLLHGVCTADGATMTRRRATQVLLAASSLGLLGGGFAGYVAALYRWLRAAGASIPGALLASWLPSLLFSAAVVLLAVASSASVVSAGFLSGGEWMGAGVGLLLVLLPFAAMRWLLGDPARGPRVLLRLEGAWGRLRRRPVHPSKLNEHAQQFSSAWSSVRRGVWARLVGFALFSAACDAASVVVLLAAARVPLRVGAAVAAWGVPHVLGNASMLPGGAGVVEATMTPFLTRFDVPAAQALLVVLAYRALAFWMPLVGGLPLIAWLERRALPVQSSAA